MTLSALLIQDHQLIKYVHTLISVTFLVVALWLFYRSFRGYFRNSGYSKLDKSLSFAFIVNLYLQLIFGLLLMAYPAITSGQEVVNQDITMKLVTKRFWPVEHMVLMLFALFIANLGLIFSNSTQDEREKHRKVLVYYSIAILMIGFSLSSTYLV
jgi:heme A synthase